MFLVLLIVEGCRTAHQLDVATKLSQTSHTNRTVYRRITHMFFAANGDFWVSDRITPLLFKKCHCLCHLFQVSKNKNNPIIMCNSQRFLDFNRNIVVFLNNLRNLEYDEYGHFVGFEQYWHYFGIRPIFRSFFIIIIVINIMKVNLSSAQLIML